MLSNLMPLTPTWTDIGLRLALTFTASTLIGLNRQSGGHAAGFRTSVLVGLAASMAMIQANLLLSVDGKTGTAFSVMDVLRFPLGVLTGVGFIGGGAILKRGDVVTGVTTAATMWVVTAIGLCFGGGQLGVGCVVTMLVLLTLGPLKRIDGLMPREQKGKLVIRTASINAIPDLGALLGKSTTCRFTRMDETAESEMDLSYQLRWTQAGKESGIEQVMAAVRARHRIVSFDLADGPE